MNIQTAQSRAVNYHNNNLARAALLAFDEQLVLRQRNVCCASVPHHARAPRELQFKLQSKTVLKRNAHLHDVFFKHTLKYAI